MPVFGIAKKGFGLLGKTAFKRVKQQIQKTPNKNFKREGVIGGKEQKKKAIQQQQDIYNKQKEDYRSPFKKGGSPAWQKKEGKSESGGLNKKGIASYRAANPGSKLSMAVTTKPSKLKKGSKAANRRKSFCARMSGMKKRLTSAKTANDPNSRINKSLRKWNC
jgi:hypothetical protein